MRVVAFLSETAGVGKSLLACHLAVEAMRASGRTVVLIELGEADGLALWRSRRVNPAPPVIRVAPADLGPELERLYGDGVGLAVIDTPAPPSPAHAEVLSWADLVVLPVAPQRGALEKIGRIVRYVETQGAPFTFVVNRAGAAHKFTAAYAMALAQHGTVCPIVIARREAFADAFAAGRVVGEQRHDDAEAADVIGPFWRFIDTMLIRLCGADVPPRPTEIGEKRRFPRWSLDWNVVVCRGDERFSCRLIDLSGAGAGLDLEADLTLGDAITLALPSLGSFDAVVVHVGDGRVGCRLVLDAERQWRLAEGLAARMGAPSSDPPEPSPSPGVSRPSPPPPSPSPPAADRTLRLAALAGRLGPSIAETAANRGLAPGRCRNGGGHRGRIIVIGNEKGGSGKSTLAVHLAIALIREGFQVATLDLDGRQATLARYLDNRRAFATARSVSLPMPATHVTASDDDPAFGHLLDRFAAGHDYVIVDTPGRDTRLSRLSHERADVVVTPINDSFLDLDLIARLDGETASLIEPGPYGRLIRQVRTERSTLGGAPDWIVVRNRLTTVLARNKADMAEAVARLADEMGFRIGPGLTERVIYRELFPVGLTLLDLRDEGVGVPMTLSHVSARQEVRSLLHLVLPTDLVAHPKQPAGPIAAAG
ncbi:MAG: division plane positioning ATPase MipZ [Rhodospirillales bacterium]